MLAAKPVGDGPRHERFEVTVRLRARVSSRSLTDGCVHEDRQPA